MSNRIICPPNHVQPRYRFSASFKSCKRITFQPSALFFKPNPYFFIVGFSFLCSGNWLCFLRYVSMSSLYPQGSLSVSSVKLFCVVVFLRCIICFVKTISITFVRSVSKKSCYWQDENLAFFQTMLCLFVCFVNNSEVWFIFLCKLFKLLLNQTG